MTNITLLMDDNHIHSAQTTRLYMTLLLPVVSNSVLGSFWYCIEYYHDTQQWARNNSRICELLCVSICEWVKSMKCTLSVARINIFLVLFFWTAAWIISIIRVKSRPGERANVKKTTELLLTFLSLRPILIWEVITNLIYASHAGLRPKCKQILQPEQLKIYKTNTIVDVKLCIVPTLDSRSYSIWD